MTRPDGKKGSRNRRHRSASAARRSGSSAATSRSRTSSAAPPGSHTRLDPADAAAAAESVTGSLEDLVNSFDEKLTQCFKDYQEQVEKIAPVQVKMITRSLSNFAYFILLKRMPAHHFALLL